MNKLEEDALNFQLQRVFAVLSRNLLILAEDLKSYHQNNFEKLYENLPPEYELVIKMADYFDDNNYQRVRKKILDITNSSKRDLESIINGQ